MAEPLKYMIGLTADQKDKLETYVSYQSNPSKSEGALLTNAVALYIYLHDQVAQVDGAQVAIVDKSGKPIEIIDPLP